MDSGGLSGGFAEGYSKASIRLWQYLDLPDIKIKCRLGVNLLGATTAYFNGRNDLEEIKRILETANYRVIAVPGAGSELETLQKIPAAQLNIVINEELATTSPSRYSRSPSESRIFSSIRRYFS